LSNTNKGQKEENEDKDEFFTRKENPKDFEEISNPFLSLHNCLQGPLMTVQILTRILIPTSLLKFPLIPVNALPLILSLWNQGIGIITLI